MVIYYKTLFWSNLNKNYIGLIPEAKSDNVPLYSEIGERDLALKHSTKTLKHRILAEMREKGALDTQIYDRIKQDKVAVK